MLLSDYAQKLEIKIEAAEGLCYYSGVQAGFFPGEIFCRRRMQTNKLDPSIPKVEFMAVDVCLNCAHFKRRVCVAEEVINGQTV